AALGRSPDDLQQRAASFLAEAGEDRGWDGGRPINSTLYLKRRGRARGWCTVRVELETGGVETAGDPARDKPPGRIFLVGPEQTLENLATAIDQAFARWGRANQREFEFNGRRLGDSRVRVGSAVRTGEPFVYVPDLGGSWRLRCQIERPDVDPNDEAGIKPSIPIPIWGWGWIPDQEGTEDASRRCPHTPPGLLQDMAWPDADKAFKDVHLAIIPVGSAEQHGPHLPLGTDFVIADHLGRRAGLELGAIVTPTIPIGYAAYHTDFAGSLSVRPETLSAYLKDICECLIKYGVTHFIFVNGHGGNEGSLTSVSRWLRDQGLAAAFISWWEVVGQHDPKWALTGHADRIETSAVMAINPDAVHLERAEPPTNRPLTPRLHPLDLLNCAFEGCKVQVGLRTSDVSATGDILEHGLHWNADHATPASAATPELGRQLMDFMVGFIVDFAREFAKVEFKPARE
ncbi:MAG TPA: creatininase family protein, partial [Bacillota bacterium]